MKAGSAPQPDDDEDDWVELTESSSKASKKLLPEVTIGVTGGFRCTLVFRGEAATRLRQAGFRYRVAIGGPAADRIKLTPSLESGRYEIREAPRAADVFLLHIGKVNAWPAEPRGRVACVWKPDAIGGGLILTLPDGFTRPAPKVESIAAPAQAAQRRIFDHRPPPGAAVAIPGDPPPGRSALDQRKSRG